jgi:putative copper resistance protein D
MSEALILTRAIHFGAVLWLVGEFVVFVVVVGPALAGSSSDAAIGGASAERRLLRVASLCLPVAVASAVVWLLLEAANMSGMALVDASNRETLGVVVRETLFGRVWLVRLALSLLLGLVLWLAWRGRGQSRRNSGALKIAGTLLAGAYAAALAGSGHAAGDAGIDRMIHLGCDAVHLLAAGAWVGALPGLLALLTRVRGDARPEAMALAHSATRRFSAMGIVGVSALAATGLVNSWYLVGSIPALLGTDYGSLLLWKLVLFAAMVALAAINRLRLTPQLATAASGTMATAGDGALRLLRRNVLLELGAGVAIVAIVSALGLIVPASHMFHGEHRHPMTPGLSVH